MHIKLLKPIKLDNGDSIEELECDFDALSFQDLKVAEKVKGFIEQKSSNTVDVDTLAAPRLNPNLRIGLAWTAAMKANPKLVINDVLKLSAKDALIIAEESLSEVF